ncbi:hypothetical protein, partial [Enterocloster clostridioformis]|uniref:hypothetical protein n=1 Tax=Enterocloster clostridioformis TaxID=1531 RepID=UPI00325B7D55
LVPYTVGLSPTKFQALSWAHPIIQESAFGTSTPLAPHSRALKNTGLSNFIFKDIRNPLVSD